MIAWFVGAALAGAAGEFEGTWVFAGGDAQKTKVSEVVEGGAQRFNFALRPIARRALTKACAIDETIVVTSEGADVVMDYRGANSRVSRGPADGSPTTVRGNTVTFKVDGTTLVVDGNSSDGGKRATYVVSGDTMKASYRISSERMGDPPLTWSLNYARK